MKPVQIEIEGAWRYGLVAFLVDRDDFLKDIEEARQKLRIKKLLLREAIEKRLEAKNIALTKRKYGDKAEALRFRLVAPNKFDDIIIKLQNKYHKSNNFQNVIKFAIICGLVVEKDLENEKPLIWAANSNTEKAQEAFFRFPQIAIVVNPETNPDDVRSKLINFIKTGKQYSKEWVLPDTVTNIKRDRIWYWQQKEGMSYEEIRKKTKKIDQPATWQAVRNAISRYKTHLT